MTKRLFKKFFSFAVYSVGISTNSHGSDSLPNPFQDGYPSRTLSPTSQYNSARNHRKKALISGDRGLQSTAEL